MIAGKVLSGTVELEERSIALLEPAVIIVLEDDDERRAFVNIIQNEDLSIEEARMAYDLKQAIKKED